MKKVELLAPAGNMDGFKGAIHAGADAVYLGGKSFGARAYADNFSTEEIVYCIRYAHLRNRKVYMTLNTLMKEDELKDFHSFFSPFYKAGLDGVIVQDLGLLAYLHLFFPDVELHCSTQMTITGPNAVEYLKKYGVTRIVPARELSLVEVEQLKKITGLEIECFIHGAMCYCYSGQCLFSSILGGRSGNRGRCAQPCRLPYRINHVQTKNELYPLSLKDMCTIEHIEQLLNAGIDSFKIEGRMKKPEYTAGVTAIYRKYIDKYYANGNCKVDRKDLLTLTSLYLRSERHEGYYFQHNGKDMVTLSSPSYSGSDKDILKKINDEFITKQHRLSIDLYAEFMLGKPATITLGYKDIYATVEGEIVQEASKQPITKDNVLKQLQKLGDTSFELQSENISLDENVFYSLKALNELRRRAVSILEDKMIESFDLPLNRDVAENYSTYADRINNSLLTDDTISASKYVFSVQEMHQLIEIQDLTEKNKIPSKYDLYIDSSLFQSISTSDATVLQKLREKSNIYFCLPYIIRQKNMSFLQKLLQFCSDHKDLITGIVVRNLEGLALLQKQNYSGRIISDSGLYIWNSITLDELHHDLDGFVKPLELHKNEKQFFDNYANQRDIIQPIYGYIPMMITANCIAKSSDHCDHNSQIYTLTDRYGKDFHVKTKCDTCMNIIYNTVPLSLHNMLHKLGTHNKMLISFTIESKEQVNQIISYFVNNEECNAFPLKEFTTGHEKRGIE